MAKPKMSVLFMPSEDMCRATAAYSSFPLLFTCQTDNNEKINENWMKNEMRNLKSESNQNRLWFRPDEWTFHKRDRKRTRCLEREPITLLRGVHSTKQEKEEKKDRPIRICQYREKVDGPSQKHTTPASHTTNKTSFIIIIIILSYLDIKLERLAGKEPNGDIASSRRQQRSNEWMSRSGKSGCWATTTTCGSRSWCERGLSSTAVCEVIWNCCIIASWWIFVAAIRRKRSAAAAGRCRRIRRRMKGRWTWQRRMKMIGSAGIAVQMLQTVAAAIGGRCWSCLNSGSSRDRSRRYGNRRWIGCGCLGGGGT